MDKEQRQKKKDLVAETTDKLGSASMVTLNGQPFLDADGGKPYVRHETLDEEQGKRNPKDKTRS
jgi:hypothetical protein